LFLNRAKPHYGCHCAVLVTFWRWIFRDDDPNRVTIAVKRWFKSFTEPASCAGTHTGLAAGIAYNINK
tara:strand:+ start:11537 stop:11740 length:204 start_codon:yes stop_codon:yes gene_type:complete